MTNGVNTMKQKILRACSLALCMAVSSCVTTREDVAAPAPDPTATPARTDTPVTPAAPNAALETVEPQGPLTLTLQDAVLRALENNASFQVERLRPAVSRAAVQEQRAAFDPTLSASVSQANSRDVTDVENQAADDETDSDSTSVSVGISESFPTGTTLDLSIGQSGQSAENASDTDSDDTDYDLTITQSLLRSRGTGPNLARLRQARLDVEISEHELRGATEALVAQTEQAYWDHILSERSIEIYEKSLDIAEQQVREVRERIRVGNLAETEAAAAAAEAASRREQLIEARGALAKKRLELIRLLNSSGDESAWNRELTLSDAPELPALKLDSVASHVKVALVERSDLNEARLQVKQGNLDIVRTRNGLLPRLDLFLSLGGSRYANSFSNQNDEDGSETSYTIGLTFEMPLGNRDARAEHERATLSLEQTKAALRNMEQLVQVDVRSAYVDVQSAEERVKATKATRELREKTLGIEEEKFRVGRSTSFLVSQARRDVVASQIAEVEAVVRYRRALLDLYRLEGSLLQRRGIETPGQ